MRKLLLAVCTVSALVSIPATAQVSAVFDAPGVSIGINVGTYPQLVPIPGYPVYYAPQLNANYFFYDGMFWLFDGENWYTSAWYDGPWELVVPELVPVYILRIPVRYYRRPPTYFRTWVASAPPHWGEHWGRPWEERRSGWDHWDRSAAPRPAPLPTYQRQYSGNRYPRIEQQQVLQEQHYRYRPHDAVAQQYYRRLEARAPSDRGQVAAPPQGQPPQPGIAAQTQRAQQEAQQRQAEQAQRAQQRQSEQARRNQQQAQQRQAEQTQRQMEQTQRAQQQTQQRQAEQTQRAQQQAQQRQAEQAQRAQQQAQQAQQRQAEQAQRSQLQAQQRQAEQAQRAQQQAQQHQAQQAQRAQQQAQQRQAQQAQQRQAQQAQRAQQAQQRQAEQAQRAQQQAQQHQTQQAQRAQQQAQQHQAEQAQRAQQQAEQQQREQHAPQGKGQEQRGG